MDFNIKDFLEKKTQQYKKPEDLIIIILKKYISGIQKNDINLSQGKVYLKNISPIQKTHIKLRKKEIIQKIQEKDITVRDII